MELKNAWGATDLRNMKCVCSSAGITNTCHTTEDSQAIVVTPPTGSLGFIRMLLLVNGAAPELLGLGLRLGLKTSALKHEQAVKIHGTTHVIWSASFVSIPQPSLLLSENDDTQRECV